MWIDNLIASNRIPDPVMRMGIRCGLYAGIFFQNLKSDEKRKKDNKQLINKLKISPIALETARANEQHYEVDADFFRLVLGRRLKYSCCYWPKGIQDLNAAEDAMLELTCARAQIDDGMSILDLGCGWGSLSIWIAEHFPNSQITAVSNSRLQKDYIDAYCQEHCIRTIRTMKADMNDFFLEQHFDRMVSIEMFEHMRNYEQLLARLSAMLKEHGKMFVHIFSNRWTSHEFGSSGSGSWMARTFFSGGLMPADDLLMSFQKDMIIADHWRINGLHYARTLRAWLMRLDQNRLKVKKVLESVYGHSDANRWLANWRMFFIACDETWRLCQGREYLVSHYLFKRNE
jgi:cyclopropane-fatty-acyl-phospholipid synthase